jgi:hypothetical protein
MSVEDGFARDTGRLESIRQNPGRVHPVNEQSARERIELARAERDGLPEIGYDARVKAPLPNTSSPSASGPQRLPPDSLLSATSRQSLARPGDLRKAATWDQAVRGIEGYRVRNGVVGRDSALGPKPKDRSAQLAFVLALGSAKGSGS